MAGWWKSVEIGACVEEPGSPEKGTWGFYSVTIPSTTPEAKILDVATTRLLEKMDDVHIVRTWLQGVGKLVQLEEEA